MHARSDSRYALSEILTPVANRLRSMQSVALCSRYELEGGRVLAVETEDVGKTLSGLLFADTAGDGCSVCLAWSLQIRCAVHATRDAEAVVAENL